MFDTILDIYFAQARFYDASSRQWISCDPAKDGLNWYKYCSNNPKTYVDPTGLYRVTIGETNNGDEISVDIRISAIPEWQHWNRPYTARYRGTMTLYVGTQEKTYYLGPDFTLSDGRVIIDSEILRNDFIGFNPSSISFFPRVLCDNGIGISESPSDVANVFSTIASTPVYDAIRNSISVDLQVGAGIGIDINIKATQARFSPIVVSNTYTFTTEGSSNEWSVLSNVGIISRPLGIGAGAGWETFPNNPLLEDRNFVGIMLPFFSNLEYTNIPRGDFELSLGGSFFFGLGVGLRLILIYQK